jgi:hypothetical protein
MNAHSLRMARYEKMRVEAGLSVASLCRAAGVGRHAWYRAKHNGFDTDLATLSRFERALNSAKISEAPVPEDKIEFLLAAFERGFELVRPVACAVNARHVARYAVYTTGAADMPTIAQALGCSKQAIDQSIEHVELHREGDAAFDDAVRRLLIPAVTCSATSFQKPQPECSK